jgi:uncharacterized protein YbbK (DUF523 family)
VILVSACLIGIDCKYTGDNNRNEDVVEYLKDKEYVVVCPEQLGGLSTPRMPAEIVKGRNKLNKKVVTCKGDDVTENFIRGAYQTLKIAKNFGCTMAIFAERSPSCGVHEVYDGSFSSTKLPGIGVTTALLRESNIKVISDNDIYKLEDLKKV